MIHLAEKHICTGCSACANVCKHKAITMHEDEEGFIQPHINQTLCTECGLCVKSCPVKCFKIEISTNKQKQTAYAFISYQDRKISSSGGAFSVFARWLLNQGGIVYGATMDEKLQVYHIGVQKIEDLDKLRGSKYVQSKIGSTYFEAKEWLKKGRKVLFTGTPCQIAGLYSSLNGKKYEGLLYTLDLVCHGVPSQGCFDSYIRKLNAKNINWGNVEMFHFRKLDSWSIISSVKFSSTKWKILEQEDNVYMNAFFQKSIFRESCYRCLYSNMNRLGIFTIADYWGIGTNGVPFNKNIASGVSLVIDNEGFIPNIIDELKQFAYIEKRPLEECRLKNKNLNIPSERPLYRDMAVKDMLDGNMTLREYAKKYHLLKKEDFKYKLLKWAKYGIHFLGLYNVYKAISYKLGRTS